MTKEILRSYIATLVCFLLVVGQLAPPADALSSLAGSRQRPVGFFADSGRSVSATLRNVSGVAHFSSKSGAGRAAPAPGPSTNYRGPSTHFQEPSQSIRASLPGQSSTLLPDGRTLLLGGDSKEGPVATALIQDAAGNTTELPNGLLHARAHHTATVLPDGSIFVFGGLTAGNVTDAMAELFDPASLQFSPVSISGITVRSSHTATLLTDGRVLIAGGVTLDGEVSRKIEFWDPRSKTVTSSTAEMQVPRRGHTAILQGDGTVLLWGGTDKNGNPLTYGEVFDPATQSVRTQASLPLQSDGLSPFVEASIPQGGDDGVPLDTLIAVRFSKPLQVQSLNVNTVTLNGPDHAIATRVVPAESGILVFLTPQTALLPSTRYTVTLSGPTDMSRAILQSTTIAFTTVANNSGKGGNRTLTGSSNNDPFDSPWRKLPALEAPPGVTAISGQVLMLDGHPLERVTLKVGSNRVETDDTGRFLLQDVANGRNVMIIDGRTANRKGITYGVFQDGVDVTSGRTNVLNYTIWMTPMDTAHAVSLTVPTTSEVVVKTPFIPGLEFHIPPGTTITDSDGKVAREVGITPIPITQPPFPLPPGVNVPVYFTIQPGGGYLWVQNSGGPKGGRLIYPNSFHQLPGSSFDFWNYKAAGQGWYIYGHGQVSANGQSIIPDPGVVVYELTGAMVGGSGLAPSNGPGPFCQLFGFFCAADPVDAGSGLFVYDKTDLYLPDVIPIKLTRTYRPNDSAFRAFGVGASHNYNMFLVGSTFPYTYMDLVFPDGSRFHHNRISPGTSFSDAVYQCNSVPGPFFGSIINWNGNGWTLTRRDGTIYKFPDGFGASRAQQGALLSITDANGNVLTISRDSNANITQITSPNNRWVQFTYDSNFRVTQAQDNIGRTVQYFYDSGGRLAKVIDANGGVWQYGYDSSNNMTSLIDPRNITYLQNQYDTQNRVVKQTLADGASTYQFAYNPNPCGSNCSGIWETDITDPNGNVEKITFNAAPVFSNGFVSGGAGSSVTHAAGTSIAQTVNYQYQAGTNLIASITDALNRITSFSYDPLGNTTSITKLAGTPEAVTTSFSYDPKFSRLTSMTDPLNHTTAFSYDAHGNLLSVSNALGNASSFAYNPQGQVVSATDPLGNASTFAYNNGSLASMTDPLGRASTYFSDGAGRILSSIDALGQRTRFSYNLLNQPLQIVDANGGVTAFSYDPNGNLLSVTDPRNTTAPNTYTYDAMDRLSTRTDALGSQESYTYDGNGNATQFTDRRGTVSTFSYDALNRMTFAGFGKSGNSFESTIGNTFDAGNRLLQTTDSIAGTINRGYDDLNRLTSESTPQGSISYTYDNASRRTSMTVSGQTAVNYAFDSVNRLTQITQGNTNVSFTYDAANRRSTLTLPNGVTASYGYDNASQLTSLVYAQGGTTLGNLIYGYDQVGRRASVSGSLARTGIPAPISATAYDANNRLTSLGNASLSYDANGNLTNDGSHTYTWDARNHLVGIDGGATASFTYDAFGRRAGKTILGATTGFVFDQFNVVQEITGSSIANSLTGGIDEIFQRSDSAGPMSFLTDALGSTLALTDATGTNQAQYSYDPFGNTSLSGPNSTNSFAYTGREIDATGLYFYRARYYSPSLQRFISEDPAQLQGGTANFYSYAADAPTQYKDPSGQCLPTAAAGAALDLGLNGLYNLAHRKNFFDNGLAAAGFGAAAGCGIGLLADLLGAGAAAAPTSVFWSGGAEAEAAATAWAEANGGLTLGMTQAGEATALATQGLDWAAALPMWQSVSADFAAGASGDVVAFINAAAYNPGSVFATMELPALLANPGVTSITIIIF